MPKVSSKRQITIPIDQCQEAHISPGDEINTYIFNGQITIIKKETGAAKGILKDIQFDSRLSDNESIQGVVDENNTGAA